MEPEIEAWHGDCWAWLIRNRGLSDFEKTRLIVPTKEYFPGTGLTGHAKAQFIFDAVRDLAGMAEWRVELAELDVIPAALSDQAFVTHEGPSCAGTFQFVDGQGVIKYDPMLQKRPVGLIATFAHELGHYLNGSFEEPPPDGWDLVEPATDVTATFLGFGLFGANESCADYQDYSEDGIPQVRRGKTGYLTEAQWVFDLAIFCRLTNQEVDLPKPYLKPHLWKQFQKAFKYVDEISLVDEIRARI